MTDTEFERACSFISRTYGLNMKAKRILLECRLAREQRRLDVPTFSTYLDMVESGHDAAIRAQFISLITTHYTYFMRESSQFLFVRDTVLPELMVRRAHSSRPWRFLCAGCSTGDECYSLAMMVEDFSKTHTIPPVTITGIDVSTSALTEARRAQYSEAHIERIPKHWREAYFTHEGDRYTVAEAIRKRVRFQCVNLAEDDALKRSYDLIFCRNTLIYFNDETKERIIKSLYQSLRDHCYLVLGHAEVIRDRSRFAYLGDSIYQKTTEATPS